MSTDTEKTKAAEKIDSHWQDRILKQADQLNNEIYNQDNMARWAERDASNFFKDPRVDYAIIGSAFGTLAGLGYSVFHSINKNKPVELFELCKSVGIGAVGGGVFLAMFASSLLHPDFYPRLCLHLD